MSDTKYESFSVGDDGYMSLYGKTYGAQTFTIGVSGSNEHHKLTSVKAYLTTPSVFSPYLTIIGVGLTDGTYPTGQCIVSGTITTGGITSTPAWIEVNMVGGTMILEPSTKYALIIYSPSSTIGNSVYWRCDGSSPAYTGGGTLVSANSGSSWTSDVTKDCLFYEYGIETVKLELYGRTAIYGQ